MSSSSKSADSAMLDRALHHRTMVTNTNSVVTPLYQNSAFPSDSPYFYTRKANPNVNEVEEVMAILEDAASAVAFSTGMAAINAVLSLLPPSSTVVLNRDMYGCSAKLFQRECERMGNRLVILDLSTAEGLCQLPSEAALIFFETPTNPFLKTISIRAIAERCRDDCLVVVDNTWANPIYQKPLKWGAHVSIHSATKYISGHSDVMGGFALCNDPTLERKLRDVRFYGGAIMDPNSAWLLRRSLQTLDVRLERHRETYDTVAEYLRSHPRVGHVYTPIVDGQQLVRYGGILFFELPFQVADRYERFRDSLTMFGTGTGMAAVTSMVAQPFSGSHASLTDPEKAAMGISRGLVRLCFGLETAQALCADIDKALDITFEAAREVVPSELVSA